MLDEYQRFVSSKTAPGHNDRDHALLGIVSEVGEIADAIKKTEIYGKPPADGDGGIYEEIGDLMFYVCMLANSQGFQLVDALAANMDKLNKRYKGGFTRDEAIERRDKK